MGALCLLVTSAVIAGVLLILYVKLNDRRLQTLPKRIASLSERLTPAGIKTRAAEYAASPAKDLKTQLPPRTGRRYIVVGGGGFLGGWIIHQLLERGESPQNIRVLDLAPTPANYVVSDAIELGLQYIKTDVSDSKSVQAAFNQPWTTESSHGTTVFHTAASIRFYELHPIFTSRSAKVNVDGVRNVIEASRKAGVDVFVFTSSGSVSVKSTRFLLWPWETEPKNFVQVINEKTPLPQSHFDFFSNYAITKSAGEKLVKEANGARVSGKKKLKTGAIRPGNGVFGPRGDMLHGAYLIRKSNPTWIQNTMTSSSYVENCALSHLLYERRLADLIEQDKVPQGTVAKPLPDISGQAFVIADPGPTPTYGDAYNILETLTDGECHFIHISPTAMFLLSKVIEFYYINQARLISFISSSFLFSFLTPIVLCLPTIKGDIINLQPSLFYLTGVHLLFDDSQARKSPENGGLGYEGLWTTYEGLYKTWEEHNSGLGRHNTRSAEAGLSLGFLTKKTTKSTFQTPVTATRVVKDGIDLPVTPAEDTET